MVVMRAPLVGFAAAGWLAASAVVFPFAPFGFFALGIFANYRKESELGTREDEGVIQTVWYDEIRLRESVRCVYVGVRRVYGECAR
jgi:hypothetical protein